MIEKVMCCKECVECSGNGIKLDRSVVEVGKSYHSDLHMIETFDYL